MNSNIEKSDKTSFVKISEQPSLYSDLEKKSVREILEDINTEDQKVALAVQKAIPQIEKLVTQIVPRMKQGGRNQRTPRGSRCFRDPSHFRDASHIDHRADCRRRYRLA